MIAAYPSYLAHLESGELERRSRALRAELTRCTLCPRRCGADRSDPRSAHCGIGLRARVAAAHPHFGEERVISGRRGSGTIFFAGCNLRCVFCQNWDISHSVTGRRTSASELAELALRLAGEGCENINFVTPTHFSHAVAEAVHVARGQGLDVPVVYNCGGYESVETLRLLEGLVEIYMPDFKYAVAEAGRKYSDAADYPRVAAAALAEMYRQVGPAEIDSRGVMTRGLLVRHLVMPADVADGRKVIDTLAETAPHCAVNVMGQYRPCYRAREFAELDARPSAEEVRSLRQYAASRGLCRVD